MILTSIKYLFTSIAALSPIIALSTSFIKAKSLIHTLSVIIWPAFTSIQLVEFLFFFFISTKFSFLLGLMQKHLINQKNKFSSLSLSSRRRQNMSIKKIETSNNSLKTIAWYRTSYSMTGFAVHYQMSGKGNMKQKQEYSRISVNLGFQEISHLTTKNNRCHRHRDIISWNESNKIHK